MSQKNYLRKTLPITASTGQKQLAQILEDLLNKNGACMTILYEFPLSKIPGAYEFGVERMFFDFYIKELNMAVEYQGRQHYHGNDFFGNEQPGRDSIKREFCEAVGICLIEIPDTIKPLSEDKVKQCLGL